MDRGLKKLCREVAKLAAEIEKDLRTRQPETASQAAGLYMFAKGYKSFQASRLLFREGFWQDAASIGRTLLELGFQARWLNQNPERAGRLFLRHELRDRLKLLRGLRSSASAEIRIKAVAFLEKLNSASDFDRSWQNWWSKESNVAKLAQEVDLSPTYDLLYRPLCWFVHSSPFANAYYLREKGGNIFSIVGRIDRHLRIEGSPKCRSPRPLLASWTFWPPPTPSLLSAASQNLTELASSSRITTKN